MPDANDNAKTAIDLARTEYATQITANPSAYSDFSINNANSQINQLKGMRQNAFVKAETDLARTQDMTANLKLYQTRTSDTDNLATQIEQNNQIVQGQIEDDKAATKRQFEINEWYNYKKESTIRILENSAVYLGLIFVAILCIRGAGKFGILPPGIVGPASVATGLLLVGLVVSTWFRFSNTSKDGQDAILWHRRRFGPSNIDPPAKPKCDPETGELIPPETEANPCIAEAERVLARLIQSNTKDIETYLEGTTAPRGSCGATKESFLSTAV
jgi:hypothetical protein